MTIDIVKLVEENPITKFSSDNYNNKLVNKIKHEFSDTQQQLFLGSFYCYLNCDQTEDFVIDLDNVWKWCGFNRINDAKRLLVKYFTIDIDYKSLLCRTAKNSSGGRPKEQILMNIKTFKKFCMKARTEKADEIHDYYIKLEELLQETLKEESSELKNQLLIKENENYEIKEKTLLEQNPKNTLCIYYGFIDNKGTKGEDLIKFGRSNDISTRTKQHKKSFDNFRLAQVYKVSNHIEIENIVKCHKELRRARRNLEVNGKNYTELLAIDNDKFTIEKIECMFKTIIEENEYNLKNYKLLLEKNENLNLENIKLEERCKELEQENEKFKSKLKKYNPSEIDHVSGRIGSVSTKAYVLYAYKIRENKYRCGFWRLSKLKELENMLNKEYNGKLEYNVKVSNCVVEKFMSFIMTDKLVKSGKNIYDGSFEDVKCIIDICYKLEEIIIKNDIYEIKDNLNNFNFLDKIKLSEDPEIPTIRKSKRAIDQIDKNTGKVLATYESIEAAGRAHGLTGSAIGIALRNKTLSCGYRWSYHGVSLNDQMTDQPVIKVCCKDGTKTKFKNIADAARDAGISSPGLRNRILTDVHRDNYHWVFDKSSTHWN